MRITTLGVDALLAIGATAAVAGHTLTDAREPGKHGDGWRYAVGISSFGLATTGALVASMAITNGSRGTAGALAGLAGVSALVAGGLALGRETARA